MRTFSSYLLKVFGVVCLIFGLFLIFLPTLMSTDWGCEQTVNIVNHFIPGQIEIRFLKLQWRKKQVVEGFVLKDPKGQPILEIEHLSIEASLWALLNRSIHLGFIQIRELNAMLAIDDKGWSNLQHALGLSASQAILPRSSLALSHVNAHLHLFSDYQPFSLWAKGVTQQQDLIGSFKIDFILNGLRASNWKEFFRKIQQYFDGEGSKRAAIQVQIFHFPTDVMDRFFRFDDAHLKDFFHIFLGRYLNMTMNKELNSDALNIEVYTPLVEGDIKGKLTSGLLRLQEPAIFQLALTPKFINTLMSPPTQLHKLTRVKVAFSYLSFPLALLDHKASHDFCQCGFRIDTMINKTDMHIHPLGLVNIYHIEAQFDSFAGDSNIHFKSTGYAEYSQKPINIHYEKQFKKPSNLSSVLNIGLVTVK